MLPNFSCFISNQLRVQQEKLVWEWIGRSLSFARIKYNLWELKMLGGKSRHSNSIYTLKESSLRTVDFSDDPYLIFSRLVMSTCPAQACLETLSYWHSSELPEREHLHCAMLFLCVRTFGIIKYFTFNSTWMNRWIPQIPISLSSNHLCREHKHQTPKIVNNYKFSKNWNTVLWTTKVWMYFYIPQQLLSSFHCWNACLLIVNECEMWARTARRYHIISNFEQHRYENSMNVCCFYVLCLLSIAFSFPVLNGELLIDSQIWNCYGVLKMKHGIHFSWNSLQKPQYKTEAAQPTKL